MVLTASNRKLRTMAKQRVLAFPNVETGRSVPLARRKASEDKGKESGGMQNAPIVSRYMIAPDWMLFAGAALLLVLALRMAGAFTRGGTGAFRASTRARRRSREKLKALASKRKKS